MVGSTAATDTVRVTVTAPEFPALTAEAGPNKSVVSEMTVTLDGSGTETGSGRNVTYLWTQTSGTGGTLTSETTLTPSFTAPALNPGDADAIHIFTLTVSDDVVGSTAATDTVRVTVTAPEFPALTAEAGPNKSVVSEMTVTLDGSGTETGSGRNVTYLWTQTSGTGGTLTGETTLTPSFTAPALNPGDADAIHIFTLTVSDDVVGSTAATDTVRVTVTAPEFPALTAEAGPNKSVVSEMTVTLDGSGTETGSGRNVTYLWTQTSGTGGTLTSETTLTPSFTAPALNPGDADAIHIFTLTVSDDVVGSTAATDTVRVTVTAPEFPALTAEAGPNKSVVSEMTVTLDGSGTETGSGRNVTYLWTQTSGTGGTLTGETTLTPSFTAPALNPGDADAIHIFTLTVSDDVVGSTAATDTVRVTVTAPEFPALTAEAGPNKSVVSEMTVTLDGSGTETGSGRNVTYLWTQTSGTGGTLTGETTLTPSFTAPALNPGDADAIHIFTLTVSDDVVGSTAATDTVRVTVTAPEFPALTAEAGPNKSVVSEMTVTLDGSGTETGSGRNVTYLWTQTSGTGGTLTGETTLTPSFTAPALNPGDADAIHIFTLTVSDDVVGSTAATDTVRVTVTAPEFPALTAEAGPNKSVVSEMTVTLDGSGTETGSGRNVTYLWTQTSGTGGTLTGETTLTPSFTAPALNPGDADAIHIFTLTVSDDVVGSTAATDTVRVTVTAPEFPALTAEAGPNKSVVSEMTVTLDGSGTETGSGRNVTYLWTQTSGTGGTLTSETTLTPSFTAPALNPGDADAIHIFTLTVSDDVVGSTAATDTVRVTVTAPEFPALTAEAGPNKSVVSEMTVTLDGSGTETGSGRNVTYLWTQTSGTGGTLTGETTLTPSFTAPALNPGDADAIHIFTLTVSDDVVGSTAATDTVRVTVTAPEFPALTAEAGPNKSVVSEMTVTLDGSGTETGSGRNVTYLWTQTSGTGGTLTSETTLTPSFTAPALNPGDADAIHIFTLTVSDDVVGSTAATDTVRVTVTAPEFPALTAEAGPNKSVVSEMTVTLDGSGTETGSGRNVTYLWTQTSGTGGTLTSETTLTPSFTAPALNPGDADAIHIFTLTVSDDVVGSTAATDTVRVTVTAPEFPALTAEAGPNKSVVSEMTVTLDGSGTETGSGRNVTYLWTQTSGTGGTLTGETTLTPSFTAPALNPGDADAIHIFTLTVSDDVVGSTAATDTVRVTVTAPEFPALTAEAGPNKSVVSEMTVTLDGSGTETGSGRNVTYLWTQTSGTGGTLTSETTLTPSFTAPALNPGDADAIHIFTLTVSDDVVGSTAATDTVRVTVTAPEFPALTAEAGPNKSVVSEMTVTLDGSGTETGSGRNVTYLWTQTSGTGGTLTGETTLTPSFTAPALNPGDADAIHIFTLTVSDDVVGSTAATDTVRVTVTAPEFPALTAEAGPNKSVVSEMTVTLDGSGTETGSGRNVTYLWTQTSGTGGTLTGETTLTPSFTAPALNPGDADAIHIFTLTVSDDVVGSTAATDTVRVTVTAPEFPALTAEAGPNKSVVSEMTVTLDGSGTETGSGRNVTYLWTQTSGTGGTLTGETTLTPSFTAPALNPGDADAIHIFTLTVSDDVVGSTAATDTVRVTVTAPEFPALTAEAGPNKSVVSEMTVTLDGSGTETGSGRNVTYLWTQTSGTGGTLTGETTLTPSFTAPALNPGDADAIHIFTLTVSDDVVGSTAATDTVRVTVTAPEFPALTAEAGPNKSVVSEMTVTLDGSGTETGSGRNVTYLWTQTSGTGGTLTGETTLTPSFTAPALNPGDADAIHIFTLTVSDDVVGSTAATDTVRVTVTAPEFPALTAEAGPNKSVVSEMTVTLDGSGTETGSGRNVTYLWTQTSGTGGTLTGETTLTPSFTAPALNPGDADAIHIFTLTVSDDVVGSTAATDTVRVTVTAPEFPALTAEAGPNKSVVSEMTVTLDGSGTETGSGRNVTYLWTQTSGTGGTLTGETTLTPSFTAPALNPGDADAIHIFTLTVSDDVVGSTAATDTVRVTVTAPEFPALTAEAGPNKSVVSEMTVTLDGSGTETGSGRNVTYLWTQTSGTGGTLTGETTLTPSFTAPALNPGDADAIHIFTLTVSDDVVGSTAATDTVRVTVTAPEFPALTAEAGPNKSVVSEMTVTLDGSGTETGSGRNVTYLWTQTSGTGGTLTGETTLTPSFTAPALNPGDADAIHIFTLTVSDDVVGSTAATDTVRVTVTAPEFPALTAEAGPNKSVVSEMTVTLDGSGTETGSGRNVTYLWTQTSGTGGTLTGETTLTPSFTAPALNPGDADAIHIFTLTVSDDVVGSTAATDTVRVTVTAPEFPALTAEAGPNKSVVSEMTVTLDGSGTETGSGRNVTYLWTQTSGTGGTLTGETTLTPSFTAPALNPGDADAIHIFTLTVSDDVVGSTAATDTVRVTVTAPEFPALTAEAGPNKSVVSEMTVTLDGSGTETGSGRNVTYLWTQTSGTGGTLTSETTLTPSFTAPALNPGDADAIHIFTLTVSDDVVGSTAATDTVRVTVTAPEFPALTAEAGPNKSVVSEMTVTLDGSGTETGSGRNVTYLWTQTSGTGGTLTSETTLTPSFTAPALNPGDADAIHIFTLTVDRVSIAGVQRRCRETRRQRCLAGQRTAGPAGLGPEIGHVSAATGFRAAAVKRHSHFGDNTLVRTRFRGKGREDRDRHRVPVLNIILILHPQFEDMGHAIFAHFQGIRSEVPQE